jgi:hypothetical protein
MDVMVVKVLLLEFDLLKMLDIHYVTTEIDTNVQHLRLYKTDIKYYLKKFWITHTHTEGIEMILNDIKP